MKVPRLPLGHPLTGLRTLAIDPETNIWKLLQEAGAKAPDAEDEQDSISEDKKIEYIIFESGGFFARLDADLARVVSMYLTARYFELCDPNYSRYRKDLERVSDALDQMPRITSPFWPAIEVQVGEGTVEFIKEFRSAVRMLCEEEGIGRRTGAPSKRAKHELIKQLAQLFEIYTGREPKPSSSAFSNFEVFVEEVDKETQKWLKQRLHDDAKKYKFAGGIEKSLRKN